MPTQDQLKQAAAEAAAQYVADHFPPGAVLGVGTGSTADLFIAALAARRIPLAAAVASSERTARRLKEFAIPVLDLNEVETLPIYVDGADEIDHQLAMIKGGGAALTREKIVAAVAGCFVCIADASKRVPVLGRFPLPVEVIPMARAYVTRELARLGGRPVLREGVITDNGNQILDVHGLEIADPQTLERAIDSLAGVVTNGLFACRRADVLLLAGAQGVERIMAA